VGEEELGDIQPAAVLRRVMGLEAASETAGLGGRKRHVETREGVDARVDHDEDDLVAERHS
jgi:hypothetical protein